jgi:hypothetical protein
MVEYADILSTVVENGRVVGNGDGSFDASSLEAEVEFEASERGLSAVEVAEAVAFALEHSEAR